MYGNRLLYLYKKKDLYHSKICTKDDSLESFRNGLFINRARLPKIACLQKIHEIYEIICRHSNLNAISMQFVNDPKSKTFFSIYAVN